MTMFVPDPSRAKERLEKRRQQEAEMHEKFLLAKTEEEKMEFYEDSRKFLQLPKEDRLQLMELAAQRRAKERK